MTELTTFHRFLKFCCIKGKDQYWERAPISTNEMEALISNHVKEYVLTIIHDDNIFTGKPPTK